MSQKAFYTPSEAAEMLDISVAMLRYLRNTGRIEGTSLGNTTVYTPEQIAKADLTKRTPGPKTEKKGKKQQASGDGGRDSSVMLIECSQAA